MTNALQAENVREISNVSYYLIGIEMGAQTIQRNIANLPFKRGFETRAEDELEKARQALTEALQAVQAAQEAYHSLPVEA